MRRLTLAFLALGALAGCTPAEDGSDASAPPDTGPTIVNPVSAKDVAVTYAHFTRMTGEPVAVNPRLALLCMSPSPEMIADVRKEFGPHTLAFVTIYMNDLAAGAFKAGAEAYPVGAVVVKEKSGMSDPQASDATGRPKRHDGVGGMIKRAPGYDPGHGDWEYFYFDDPAKIETGRIASCVQCHAGAANTDHVFGGWHARGPLGRRAMTANEFRGLALALPEAVEAAHMDHPDFRVRGKIFATLGPAEAWGMVKLNADQQARFIAQAPDVFQPVPGGWAARGATRVTLEAATERPVREALIVAWRNVAPKGLSRQFDDE